MIFLSALFVRLDDDKRQKNKTKTKTRKKDKIYLWSLFDTRIFCTHNNCIYISFGLDGSHHGTKHTHTLAKTNKNKFCVEVQQTTVRNVHSTKKIYWNWLMATPANFCSFFYGFRGDYKPRTTTNGSWFRPRSGQVDNVYRAKDKECTGTPLHIRSTHS